MGPFVVWHKILLSGTSGPSNVLLAPNAMLVNLFISRSQAVWPTPWWMGSMLLWCQWSLKQSESWFEWITLGHLQITITELRTTTFRKDAHRFSDETFCLAKRVAIKLCSILGLCHHYFMRLIIRSLKEGSMTMGPSLRLNSCLEDTRSTWLHEAKASFPTGWSTS